jgi:hypothetical protein
MKKISSFIFALLFAQSAFAQNDSAESKAPKKHHRYYNQFLAGTLMSPTEPAALSASMVHGFAFKSFRAGVGISYDVYEHWRTNPFYASISVDFAKAKFNRFFLQMNAGSVMFKHLDERWEQFTYKEQGGYIIHPSIGYRITAEKWSVYITGGYKFQQIKYVQANRWWPEGYKNTVTQKSERIVVQIGFGLH